MIVAEQPLPAVFVGLDVGKSDHHAVAVTSAGKTIYDKALPNDETRLRAILEELAAPRWWPADPRPAAGFRGWSANR